MEPPFDTSDARRAAELGAAAEARKTELAARIDRLRVRTRSRSAARLRVLVYPALLAVLLVRFGGAPAAGWTGGFEPLTGGSFAGTRTFDEPAAEPVRVRPGYLVGTGPAGSARLTLGSAEVRFEPSTRALVERLAPRRLRLLTGRVSATGELEFSAPGGVASLAKGSTARLEVRGRELHVAVLAGAVELTGPRRSVRLTAGDSAAAR